MIKFLMSLLCFSILAVGVGISCALSQDTDSAPFGLSWGVGSKDVQALGATLSKIDGQDFGNTFTATSLPKTLSDVQFTYLSFGHDDRLWRIAAVSRDFERDGSGAEAEARYNELKSTLASRYGKPQEYERLSTDDFYARPENFVYGIYSNKNHWFSVFETPALEVELSIGASGTSDAYWRIVYTNKSGQKAFQSQHQKSESDAL